MKNYEQIHNESLEKIKDYLASLEKVNDGVWSFRDIQKHLLEIFPELRESDDEKIKKDLLYFLNAHIGCSIAPAFCTRDIIKWVAWIEKQGDQKIPKKQWKPSEMIIDSLYTIIEHPDRMTDYNKENLKLLYEQLKKQLKEL